MIHLLKAAVDKGLISEPHVAFAPKDFPLSIAVSAIALPDGCAGPVGQPRRLGTAIHRDKRTATVIAMAEAAERYSLQFDPALPALQHPIAEIGRPADPALAQELRLGAPGGTATSVGCAAHETMQAAINSAALEHLEHLALAQTAQTPEAAVRINLSGLAELAELVAYLEARLREVRAEISWFEDQVAVVRAICCDFDGGRPTEGSAASTSPEAAATKAVLEAVASWRNMIEIERVGIATPKETAGDLLLAYRGASSALRPIAGPVLAASPKPPKSDVAQHMVVDVLHKVTRQPLRVFDMTHPAIGLPVARIVLG